MKDLFEVVDLLIENLSKHERAVLKTYKKSIEKQNFTVARIISDELQDYAKANLSEESQKLATEIYDKTMELYELNT